MDQMQREILGEIEELVGHIAADLDKLRATTTEGAARREQIAQIFRSVHSIKGSAASCDLKTVSRIAHEFEHLLAEVQAGRVSIDGVVIDTFESATQALSESLSIAAAGKVAPSYEKLFDRLRAAAQSQAAGSESPTSETMLDRIPAEIRESLKELEKQQLITIAAEGSPIHVVACSFDIRTFDEEFVRLKEKLARFGEIISTSPAVDEKHPDQINFRVLYASNADLQALSVSDTDFSGVIFEQVFEAASPDTETTASESNVLPSVSTLANFVRTDLEQLDSLIAATHDLFRMTSTTLSLAMSQMTIPAVDQLQKLDKQIRSSFIRLEDELIKLRLVPLGSTLERVARAGRAAARVAAKEIDFAIIGSEIHLDKLLVQALANPLIQLVRNAVDHGIETADERALAGKQQRGVVRIEAISDGSQVGLRVSDDGRGVDPMLVSAAAKRLGLLPEDAELNIEQSLRLIFRPGFTTLDAVSNLSGRGVGLDVVETSVEQVGGELRVSSKPGAGATFEMLLPVTFTVMAGNVVVSAGNRYCIPTAQTLGIDAIDVVDGSSGANQLRQVSLRDLLGQPDEDEEESSGALQLITCQYRDARTGAGDQQAKFIGIVVDRVEGPQEVLVRNLGQHAGRWYGVAGATELKDGNVALVLDLPRLLSS
jgi:two-component system chemotaxis sensor kinase CheA